MMPAPMTRTGALSRERRLIGFSSFRERDRSAVMGEQHIPLPKGLDAGASPARCDRLAGPL
jgi:hypothetical protein